MRRPPVVTVVESGPLSTVQDTGRFGLVELGVGLSGACDQSAYALANRIVGNQPGAGCLEVTFGGLAVRANRTLSLALTGARCPATAVPGSAASESGGLASGGLESGGSEPGGPGSELSEVAAPAASVNVGHGCVLTLPTGWTLRLARPVSGVRTYVAVRGGVDVAPVLGSRSTDVLSGLGPPVLQAGMELPVGSETAGFPEVDWTPHTDVPEREVTVRLFAGPRRDWCTDESWQQLRTSTYVVSEQSNRVGLRLDGPVLERARNAELPSEGMLRGALQLPPVGTPVLFLADHPLTGGYPVIGCVHDEDLDLCGQLRPGQSLRFREVT